MKPILSPRDLAEAIGVSESSVKRWADEGHIRVSRTAGGHRRIHSSEAIRFVRDSKSVLVKPEILGLTDVAAVGERLPVEGEEGALLFEYLKAGLAVEARGLLVSLYLGGKSMAQLFDGPLKEAMARVGEEWQHSEAGIFYEHRATDIAIHAVHQVRALLPPNDDGAPRALGGAPSGDPYILPSLCAATVLNCEGYRSSNLGPDTPSRTLLEAARKLNPQIVWLSLSGERPPARLGRELAQLIDDLAELGASLVVGGTRRDQVDLPAATAIYVGDSMSELAAFAQGLRHSH